ncbi:MAG: HD domain-containing protein [Saprospiraceae bacterium]
MNKRKIINDPVYGFTTIPDEFIFDLIQHPWFQRLRRIRQLGLTDYVYPGATHSRFQHALGALHLMTLAIESLRAKGVEISDSEAQGAEIAILLHDIGHSPFSHALEKKFIPWSHEKVSLAFMNKLNTEFDGKLLEAIKIFSNKHPKKFLHQLVSGQLDVDRMDYLNRDSFYSGVAEGVIGYERIIKMLHVYDHRLVVEEKGIYSIEKFLISRRIMYWQVYLHKTVLSAEKMLIHWFDELCTSDHLAQIFPKLKDLQSISGNEVEQRLINFAEIDDTDIFFALKQCKQSQNSKIRILSEGLLNRNLFKCQLSLKPFDNQYINKLKKGLHHPNLIFKGKETNEGYNVDIDEIMILSKENKITPLSKYSTLNNISALESKYYLVYL